MASPPGQAATSFITRSYPPFFHLNFAFPHAFCSYILPFLVMPTTLLDILTAPNLQRVSLTGPGSLTIPPWTPAWPGTWVGWKEFNYKTLLSIYEPILNQKCSTWMRREHTEFDIEILNEDTFDHFLTLFNHPIINHALAVALETLERPKIKAHLGRGSRCSGKDQGMDWCLISPNYPGEHNKYANVLPGDSKLQSKWNMGMFSTNHEAWLHPVDQILGYMITAGCRYGYIITDHELYVFRITLQPITSGTAADRPLRGTTSLPENTEDDTSLEDLSTATASITISSAWTEEYDFEADLQSREYMVECAMIPWSSHGSGQLTVNLALWCLAMMSLSDRSIKPAYKRLDSWTKTSRGYVSDISGIVRSKLPKGAVIDNGESDDAQEAGVETEERGEGSQGRRIYDITQNARYEGKNKYGNHIYSFTAENGSVVKTRMDYWVEFECGKGFVYEKSGKMYLCRRFPSS
ncbi:hypothetical protein RB595_006050 [Gaeumannomyces hyphopodioides]